MKRHANIPIFIPHLGCPNQCVFCNQHTITGIEHFHSESIRPLIESALATIGDNVEVEIAFFGGSFTGIDYDLMCNLLEIAHSYICDGRVKSIRCSTRPDYIDKNILDTLKKYGVKVIELGLQSSSDDVLKATKRGHTLEDELRACNLIVSEGFELVGQMMIGLPGSTLELEEKTADFIINSGAVAARIYPTVVFRSTELCTMAERGVYKPLSTDEAVFRSARILKKLRDAGIKVIRIGLCASENLTAQESYYAGPNHSALGELVENEFYYQLLKEKILKLSVNKGDAVRVVCPLGAVSKIIGQKRKNKLRLISEHGLSDLVVQEGDLPDYELTVQCEERK